MNGDFEMLEGDMNRRILIVDDDRTIHESIKDVLAESKPAIDPDLSALKKAALMNTSKPAAESADSAPFVIDSAFQGEEGLSRVLQALEEQSPYALIFMDVRMPPGWDGLITIQEIWKVAPNTEMVVISAYSD